MTQSKIKFENKYLNDCTKEQLIQACESLYDMRERAKLERDTYADLLKTNFPIHKLWTDFLTQLWSSLGIIFLIYIAFEFVREITK